MASENEKPVSFAPMTSILKKPTSRDSHCSDWVATEKVHGASFQFYTRDGETIHLGSRTRCLDGNVSFQKCNLPEFHERYAEPARRLFKAVMADERWTDYRVWSERAADDSEDEDDCEEDNVEEDVDEVSNTNTATEEAESKTNEVEVRIYGELYGGGGVRADTKRAVQKEILYCDEFRFYVFGITINRKWVNIVEMNDLCKMSGFPYFAIPVCEPKSTLEELQNFLITSGFMNSRSRLTEREDDVKTKIEGVVMSPLTRPDYRSHAIKLLSAAFTDVRQTFKGKAKTPQVNYCTKARYLSVISKLDIPEREDTEMVINMFVEDIQKESGEELSTNKSKGCAKAVRGWLMKDGYLDSFNGKSKTDRDNVTDSATASHVNLATIGTSSVKNSVEEARGDGESLAQTPSTTDDGNGGEEDDDDLPFANLF